MALNFTIASWVPQPGHVCCTQASTSTAVAQLTAMHSSNPEQV
jgi:hypothetical protein